MDRRKFFIGSGAALVAVGGAAVFARARMGSMDDYAAAQVRLRSAFAAHAGLNELIRFATLAPNGHNTQPWRFRAAADHIAILPDLTRRTPVVDPDDHHLFISLGCAAENLDIAARAQRQGGELTFAADAGGRIDYRFGTNSAVPADLLAAIPKRQSTRAPFSGAKVPSADLQQLAAAAKFDGVGLTLLTAQPDIAKITELVVAGNSAQMADPAFVAELLHWLRFNPHDAIAQGDGLFSALGSNPILPGWLGQRLFPLGFKAATENRKYREQLATSAGVAVFFADQAGPEHWIQVGRAAQRFALQATALGLKLSFVNQPVEVPQFRSDLAALAGMPGRRPDLVVRFGYGPTLPYSIRRPITSVML